MPSTTLTVACTLCEAPTAMGGTKMCDRCYELDSRIRWNPQLARRILASIDAAKSFEERNAARELRIESEKLEAHLSEVSGIAISHLWGEWDETLQTVVFNFNPGNSLDCWSLADRGRYTKEELEAWAAAKCAYHLTPALKSH